MKKILLGALALGLLSVTVVQADKLSEINMETLGYSVLIEKGQTCKKIDNAVAFKNQLLKKFGDIGLKKNLEWISEFTTEKNGVRYSYMFGNNLYDCDSHRRHLNEVAIDNSRDPLFSDLVRKKTVVTQTIEDINMDSLVYKLKVDYGESCVRIRDAEKFKKEIMYRYGKVKLIKNFTTLSAFNLKGISGKIIVYKFSDSLKHCREIQREINKNVLNKGYKPLFIVD